MHVPIMAYNDNNTDNSKPTKNKILNNSTNIIAPLLTIVLILASAVFPVFVNGQLEQNTLTVIKQVVCPPNTPICPLPSQFTMQILGNNPIPNTFSGSQSGIDVNIGDGNYEVNEGAPNALQGLVLYTTRSADCNGFISQGQSLTCTITNRYLQANGDEDGDGLLNTWEINGIDQNNDGVIDYAIPQSNPLHKNLYVEVDYMNNHRPIGGNTNFGAIEDVRRAFRNAPVSNPDNTPGVNLLVQLDENITHQGTTNAAGLATIKSQHFGTIAERADPNSANLLAAKRRVFHYAVFAHDQPGDFSGSSGVSDGTPSMNFLITLGAQGYARDPVTNHSVGTRDEQAATFIHELGHNLGLQHGGGDAINCKPNYLSVMNYLFQFSNLISGRPLDYSRSALATLNKTNLNEPDGISQSTPPNLNSIYGPVGPRQGPGFTSAGVPVDWNFNGRATDRGVISDVNRELVDGRPNAACGTPGPGLLLNGFNDWNAITYIVSPQQLAARILEVPIEETVIDIIQSRLELLEGIDNAIQRLKESQPTTVSFNTTHIAQLLKTDQLEEAIVELDNLQAQVIKVFGQSEANKQVVPQIQNLIVALEKQEFSPPPPPPAEACVTGSATKNSVIIRGTDGPDTLIGNSRTNIISGLGVDDRINGCAGADIINGNDGNDGIAGGDGNDLLHGGPGDDIVQGDAGNDVIFGDAGHNVLTGGPGRDVFFCSPEGDIITDFVPGIDIKRGNCTLATAEPS
jgi:hypothetical protein